MSNAKGETDPETILCDVCEAECSAEGSEQRSSPAKGETYHVCATCLANEPCERCEGYHHHAAPCGADSEGAAS